MPEEYGDIGSKSPHESERKPTVTWKPLNHLDTQIQTTDFQPKVRFTSEYVPTKVFGDVTIKPKVERYNGREEEKVKFVNGTAMRISSDDFEGLHQCQDAFSLSVNQYQRLESFAIADGVSMGFASKSVADIAASSAVNILRKQKAAPFDELSMRTAIRNTEDTVQQGYDKSVLETDLDNASVIPMLRDILKKRLEKGGGGSTTLITGVIENDTLHVGHVGDGGFIVLNKEGVVRQGGGYESGVPAQITASGRKIESESIHYNAVPLAKEDVILAFSDGLLKGSFPDGTKKDMNSIAQKAKALIREGKTSQEISRELIEGSEGKDDLTLLAFKHTEGTEREKIVEDKAEESHPTTRSIPSEPPTEKPQDTELENKLEQRLAELDENNQERALDLYDKAGPEAAALYIDTQEAIAELAGDSTLENPKEIEAFWRTINETVRSIEKGITTGDLYKAHEREKALAQYPNEFPDNVRDAVEKTAGSSGPTIPASTDADQL